MTDRPVLRTGRKVGRTVYRQIGSEPSDMDTLIGVMDTREIATMLVDAWNEVGELREILDKVERDQCGCLGGPLTAEWARSRP